eukprot:2564318-Alexandrium_andersonii.AAC.1
MCIRDRHFRQSRWTGDRMPAVTRAPSGHPASAPRPAQVDQRRLVVGLQQDPLVVSQPADARHSLVNCVFVQAPLAQDR